MKHNTIKQLPVSERPYEKALSYGVNVLSDAELIACILRTGSRDKTSVGLAIDVLNMSEARKGLNGLMHAKLCDLKKIDGIGDVKAIELMCVTELAKRMSRVSNRGRVRMNTPESVASFFMQDMRSLESEHLYVALFDMPGHLIKYDVLFKGTIDSSQISPREILRFALSYDAANIIILHNHPGGEAYPSDMDDEATYMLYKSCKLVGIPLIDHIIIGDDAYFSYAGTDRLKKLTRAQ